MTPLPRPAQTTTRNSERDLLKVEPPPIRVVEKGWWSTREWTETLEEAKKANDERQLGR